MSITGGRFTLAARAVGTEQTSVKGCVWLICLRITAATPGGTAELFTALIFTSSVNSLHLLLYMEQCLFSFYLVYLSVSENIDTCIVQDYVL